ncbi:protein FAM186B isoform X1 [Oncorhynchus tshawytscha]|uniref:protein FAM186B isoform X1 n=1 Tax=Oncorhynchus tshawytscha TaxID=74940 RepID=UPI001C3DB044|nr:protein FAM186B isoform X1 [Oncorhynchus tshawytscha]
MPVYRALLGAGILGEDCDDEDDTDKELLSFLPDLDERRWRREQINKIRDFLNSAVARETDLTLLLDWLTEAQESLQTFENERATKKEGNEEEQEEVTSEWIEDIQRKLETSINDTDGCIHRLRGLCQGLFDTDVKKKTKKEEAALNKGVWRWWREQKVDARTIKRIQELQPPAADVFLSDVNLATKSATELSFMVLDVAKALGCNKAMSLAFKFVTVGLQNLNQAFQERTKEARKLLAQVEELQSMDCRFQLAQIKIQVGDSQIKMTKMEDELSSVKEQNNILLFQIQQLQENPKHPQPKQQIVVVAPTKYVQGAPVLNNQLVPQPTPKLKYSKRRPKPKPEPSQPVGEEVEEVESLEDISVDPEDIIEQVERKSMDLLEAIQNSEQCVVSISGDKDKGKDGELQEGMDVASRKAKAADIIKLYCDLQRSIRDSFNDMITQLQGKFDDDIIGVPLMDNDNKLDESAFWDSTQRTPGDTLKEISNEIQNQDRTVKDVGANKQALFDLEGKKTLSNVKGKSRHHSLNIIMDQFKNLNEMGKKQVTEKQRRPRRCSILVQKTQKRIPVKMAESRSWTDHVERYSSDMTLEADTLMKSRMVGVNHIFHVESQRSNLKLLHQAVVNRHISPQLYRMLKDIIIQTLSSVENRLLCLIRRFIKHKALQHVRNNLNARLLLARDMSDGQEAKDLYKSLERLDVHQSTMTRHWSEKQTSIELTRTRCLAHMLYLFSQLRVDYNLHLATPVPCNTSQDLPHPIMTVVPTKLQWSLRPSPSSNLPSSLSLERLAPSSLQTPPSTHLYPPTHLDSPAQPHPSSLAHHPPSSQVHLPPPLPETYPWSSVHSQKDQGKMKTLWQADKTMRCMWLARKIPAGTSNIHCIPRLLEMDVNRGRVSAMRTLHARMTGVLNQMFLDGADEDSDVE